MTATNERNKYSAESVPADQEVAGAIRWIISNGHLTPIELSQVIGTSLISITRWQRGDSRPSPGIAARIFELTEKIRGGEVPELKAAIGKHVFASRGIRTASKNLPLFDSRVRISLDDEAKHSFFQELKRSEFWSDGHAHLEQMLREHDQPAPTLDMPAAEGISAGKNTYTYDAHTYHTKVPPQGIAEILKQYLPAGGLVLDPFAGSGMTGVAARTLGYDTVLNELSPAASFISDRFTRSITPDLFLASINAICDELRPLRRQLYETECRECGKPAEMQYAIWSYRVICSECGKEFVLWDHCRKYGRTVREHKILSEIPCPHCKTLLKKSRLARTNAVPVRLGYKCCTRQTEHPLKDQDFERLGAIEANPPVAENFFPTTELPAGVNLGQPRRHGLISIDRFYTPRNLAAMSHLWRAIHRIPNADVAGFAAFVFTSLYQRVTRLSEYRFWGGSGNTANFNVPYIFNEANVFTTFERKARTIQDHLETTARHYRGCCVVHTGSATKLEFLPDASVDLIFTDPPFGANINYSEMNILWESWFGNFTETENEAIVNKVQGKDAAKYGALMAQCLKECYRVLRPNHWMLLVFMNSSQEIWNQLRLAIRDSGFRLERIDTFDKQHGTFKQFVSDNTAGFDLILHCRKVEFISEVDECGGADVATIEQFLSGRILTIPRLSYLHVNRMDEVDYRMLYSEWLAANLLHPKHLLDFSSFREVAARAIENLATKG